MIKFIKLNKLFIPLIFGWILFCFSAQEAAAQNEISIEECYTWAHENYPMVRQLGLIDKSSAYSLENAAKGFLPQININGQASYQSDVTVFPIKLPNVEVPAISKDQYKVFADIYQPLSNGSMIKNAQKLIDNGGEIQKQQIEVDLYKLKDRVNQLYFGVRLMNANLKQMNIVVSDLDSVYARLNAGVKNGTATITDLKLIRVEQLSVKQKMAEQAANKKAFLQMLSYLTGKEINEKTTLIEPSQQVFTNEINRPELRLFELQRQSFAIQAKRIDNKRTPNFGLFLQTGYGRPALNFLKNDFAGYYIGGLKLNWNLSNFYTSKNERANLKVGELKLDAQKETFLLNTNLTKIQQSAEIEKYQSLITSDKEIIEIRTAVKETASVQLTNGLITTIDYIMHLNEEDKAKQLLTLHETQLILAQYNLKTTVGE